MVGLYKEKTVDRVRGSTVVHVDITDTAGYFAADHYAAVSVFHFTVTYNDVFTRNIPFTSIGITSRFDSDAVVTGVECTILYQHVFAGFRVTSVSVGTTVENVHSTYDQAFTEKRVNHPERRIQQSDIFYEDGVAGVQIDELRT